MWEKERVLGGKKNEIGRKRKRRVYVSLKTDLTYLYL